MCIFCDCALCVCACVWFPTAWTVSRMDCKWVSQTLIRTDFLSLAEWKIISLVPKILGVYWDARGSAASVPPYLPLPSVSVVWAARRTETPGHNWAATCAVNYLWSHIAFLERSSYSKTKTFLRFLRPLSPVQQREKEAIWFVELMAAYSHFRAAGVS